MVNVPKNKVITLGNKNKKGSLIIDGLGSSLNVDGNSSFYSYSLERDYSSVVVNNGASLNFIRFPLLSISSLTINNNSILKFNHGLQKLNVGNFNVINSKVINNYIFRKINVLDNSKIDNSYIENIHLINYGRSNVLNITNSQLNKSYISNYLVYKDRSTILNNVIFKNSGFVGIEQKNTSLGVVTNNSMVIGENGIIVDIDEGNGNSLSNFSGSGKITKIGKGYISLSAQDNYDGEVEIQDGSVYLSENYNIKNAKLTTVRNGASLKIFKGFDFNRDNLFLDKVGNLSVDEGAIFDVDGHYNILGDYTQNGILKIRSILDGKESSKINVSGKVTISPTANFDVVFHKKGSSSDKKIASTMGVGEKIEGVITSNKEINNAATKVTTNDNSFLFNLKPVLNETKKSLDLVLVEAKKYAPWTKIENTAITKVPWTKIEDTATTKVPWTKIENTATTKVPWTKIENTATTKVPWTKIEDTATTKVAWTKIEDTATTKVAWTKIEDTATTKVPWTKLEDTATTKVPWTKIENTAVTKPIIPDPLIVTTVKNKKLSNGVDLAWILANHISKVNLGDWKLVVDGLGRLSTAHEVTSAVGQIMPLIHGNMANIIMSSLSVGNHLNKVFDQKTGLWVSIVGNNIEQKSYNNISGYTAKNSGVFIGGDFNTSNKYNLGLGIGYINSDIDGKDYAKSHNLTSKSLQFQLYGNYALNDSINFKWKFAYTRSDIKSERNLTFIKRKAKGKTHADSMNIGFSIDKDIQISNKFNLIPSMGLDFTQTKIAAFSENKAGVLNYRYEDQKLNEMVLSSNIITRVKLLNNLNFKANLGLGYNILDDKSYSSVSFTSGEKLKTIGISTAKLNTNLGFAFEFKPSLASNINLGYQFKARKKQAEHNMGVEFGFRF